MGGNSDMKSKRYTIIGIVAIVSLIFFVVVTFCGKGHQWSNNVVQGFKSLGLKGNVKVIRTYKEIEAFHGTVVEVNYTERFSDGYFLDENLRADIREYNGGAYFRFLSSVIYKDRSIAQ